MWHTWTTILLVSCALVKADGEAVTETEAPVPVATTRAPPRTLDRKPNDLLHKTWLDIIDGNKQNGPPRRITTKSLFTTPLVCAEGPRRDQNGCINVISPNAAEHEGLLLEQISAMFTPPNVSIDAYDYSDVDTGPLQLSIPIGSDPQAAPLQGQEPYAQAQDLQPNYVKKDGIKIEGDAAKAELELLSLSNVLNQNGTAEIAGSDNLNQNLLTNTHNYPDKPKRDSPILNATEMASLNNATDVGQKELVYGHVNVDPVLYNTDIHESLENIETSSKSTEVHNSGIALSETNKDKIKSTIAAVGIKSDNKTAPASNYSTPHLLKKDSEQSKLNPENDYSDIGETIKLISRYADVTTDDNFAKEQNNNGIKGDSILGTRTKAQYRRNKPTDPLISLAPGQVPLELVKNDKTLSQRVYPGQTGVYYRYPWSGQNSPTPPPEYPFRHLQDYWPGRNQIGGVYNTHLNPRRHHHSYPHNFRLHSYPHAGFGVPPAYPEQLKGYIHRVVQHHANPMRAHNTDNQDLYSLLGLRHWFSSEGTSKR